MELSWCEQFGRTGQKTLGKIDIKCFRVGRSHNRKMSHFTSLRGQKWRENEKKGITDAKRAKLRILAS